jgi:CheY-like chemotaxis protein
MNIEEADYPLDMLMNDLYRLTAENIREKSKDIKLVMEKPPKGHDDIIKTDPLRLKQILLNLLGNAVKFTESGKIEFGYCVKDNKTLEFYVKDTGIGIAKDKKPVIFDRFWQADDPSRKHEGMGLGLSIARKLVNLLGGEIDVDSKLGKGSRFYFTIPYHPVAKAADEKESSQIPLYKGMDRLILIVEDDPLAFKLDKLILEDAGYRVIRAKNGKDAFNKFCRLKGISAVLMDIRMPDMNGFEATKNIREYEKGHNMPPVPIIALTALAMHEDEKKCKDAGSDEYLAKPVKKHELLEVLDKYIFIGKR